MSGEWAVRRTAQALMPGDRFIFTPEYGGEGETLTVESVSRAFGTMVVTTKELDYDLDFAERSMLTMARPVEDEGVEPPTPTMENTRAKDTEEIEVLISLRVPKTLPEKIRESLVMALTTYAADLRFTIEAGVEVNRGASFNDLRFLQNEVGLAADVVKQVDTGEVWCKFTCSEIEAIADVFRAADRHDAAVFIVDEHADSDEPGDHHYKGDNDE